HFCTRHLSAINDTLETYQFGVRVMLPTC
ncbi:AAA family ATPase, partial [Klebsiella pneumoniae]|nr:AAA family ATPase [Klebsiella pneumoniae]